MPTVNERVFDFSVRHQVGIQRLAAGVVKKIAKLMDRADADIVAQLLKRGPTLEGSTTSIRLEYLLRAVRTINHDAHVQLGQDLRQELRSIAKYESSFQYEMFNRFIPVRVDIIAPTAPMLNAIVSSRPLSGRYISDWVKNLELGTRRRIEDQIRIGMVQGESMDDIIRRIAGTRSNNYRDGAAAMSRRQAENLVRTSVNHVANAARETFYQENDDLVKGVQWVATLDTRTCEVCMGYDGTVFSVDSGARPPAHPSCRCCTVPVLKSWRELGIDIDELAPSTRASMNGQVPETMNYNQWLKTQSAAVQDEALGPSRGRLFRDGGLAVDRFTDTRGNQLNLDQLSKREAAAFEKAGLAA